MVERAHYSERDYSMFDQVPPPLRQNAEFLTIATVRGAMVTVELQILPVLDAPDITIISDAHIAEMVDPPCVRGKVLTAMTRVGPAYNARELRDPTDPDFYFE